MRRPPVCKLQTPLKIERAQAADVPSILSLKQKAFEKYRSFIPYKAPESERLLAQVLSDPERGDVNVAREGDQLVGYTIAKLLRSRYHLSYIATEPKREGEGIGRALFRRFEEDARAGGASATSLDVFESNTGACGWYQRRGYTLVQTTSIVAVNMAPPIQGSEGLKIDENELRSSLDEEEEQGASTVMARLGELTVRLGLIAGSVIRLNNAADYPLPAVLAAIQATFGPSRERIVVSGFDKLPAGLNVLQSEISCLMEKPLV